MTILLTRCCSVNDTSVLLPSLVPGPIVPRGSDVGVEISSLFRARHSFGIARLTRSGRNGGKHCVRRKGTRRVVLAGFTVPAVAESIQATIDGSVCNRGTFRQHFLVFVSVGHGLKEPTTTLPRSMMRRTSSNGPCLFLFQ